MAHPHVVDPASGAIVNWNNKPAAGFSAADDNWSYGSVHRVLLLDKGIAAKKIHTPASVVSAMNLAATTDLRWTLVPLLADVMSHGTAPSARDNQMLSLLGEWDGSRLDANLDGKIDEPGAAIMDAWWPRLAVAVLQPVLGPLTDQLKTLAPIDNPANPNGSSYGAGWYSYVDKDLRTLLGQKVPGAYSTAVLRRREHRGLRGLALAVARRRRQRARRGAGLRPGRVARRRDRGADPVLRLHPGHDALDEPPDLPAGHPVR